MDNKSVRDKVFGSLLAFITVVSLLLIGNYQANQYRSVTDRVDRGVQAIVCVFNIDTTKLPRRDTPEYQVAVRKVIRRCFDRYEVGQPE